MTMDPAKMQCETIHVVSRDGLYFSISKTKDAMLAGGRGVKSGISSSGLLTTHGRTTDITKVIIENAMSAVLPIRPTWPVKSSDVFASTGASYRR